MPQRCNHGSWSHEGNLAPLCHGTVWQSVPIKEVVVASERVRREETPTRNERQDISATNPRSIAPQLSNKGCREPACKNDGDNNVVGHLRPIRARGWRCSSTSVLAAA